MILNSNQRSALIQIRAIGKDLTHEQLWNDRRFDCIGWQQTIGPMALELISHCMNNQINKAIQINEYNDADIMFSVLQSSLNAWTEK